MCFILTYWPLGTRPCFCLLQGLNFAKEPLIERQDVDILSACVSRISFSCVKICLCDEARLFTGDNQWQIHRIWNQDILCLLSFFFIVNLEAEPPGLMYSMYMSAIMTVCWGASKRYIVKKGLRNQRHRDSEPQAAKFESCRILQQIALLSLASSLRSLDLCKKKNLLTNLQKIYFLQVFQGQRRLLTRDW